MELIYTGRVRDNIGSFLDNIGSFVDNFGSFLAPVLLSKSIIRGGQRTAILSFGQGSKSDFCPQYFICNDCNYPVSSESRDFLAVNLHIHSPQIYDCTIDL